MSEVFISYKSDDRGSVVDIVEGLHAEGLDVWWDQGIAPSAEWRTEIHDQLQAAKVAIVVWSRNSVDFKSGKWVIQEAEDADGRGVLVPVVIDDVLPPLGLRHVQAADLVDWRGDRSDPRWIGFIETVRARLEGRAINAAMARDVGPATAGASMRGRGALIVLATGLAALAVTTTIAFGPLLAAALAAGLALAYVVMNLLFSRRRGDRAAQTFLRRAFAVGWVTVVANVVVWGGAMGAAAFPYAWPLLYPDFSIAVFDELRTPVPGAQVTVTFDERSTRVDLGKDGVGRMSYPLYWGSQTGVVTVGHNEAAIQRPIERAGGRFADLSLGVPSGVARVRVTHVTLENLAIDAIHNGLTPPEIARIFPGIVGVLRNRVWQETEAYLSHFPKLAKDVIEVDETGFMAATLRLQGEAAGVEGFENNLEGDPATVFSREMRGLRWAQTVFIEALADLSGGVFACPIAQPLAAPFALEVASIDSYYLADSLMPDTGAKLALRSAGLDDGIDENGALPAILKRMVDGDWIDEVLSRADPLPKRAGIGWGINEAGLLRYFQARKVPHGVIDGSIKLAVAMGCEERWTSALFDVPAAQLRVSIVKNVSDAQLPIGAIVQGLSERDGISLWTSGDKVSTTDSTRWVAGVLNPGESIAVPRRLFFQGLLSPAQAQQRLARATGQPVGFTVRSLELPPERSTEGSFAAMYKRSATAFTIRSGQIAAAGDALIDRDALRLDAVYAAGPSVQTLAVEMNGVEFPLREDAGVTLAMLAGFEVGSCPFVYAANQDGQLRNRGPIITDLVGIGAEGRDRVYLGRSVTRVELRELEPEISHFDQARLIVVDESGGERSHAPASEALRAVDGRRVTLNQGDVVVLSFPEYTPRFGDRAVYLEGVGYYTPLPATTRDFAALVRAGIRR